jgi:hypothetical protein
MFDCIEVQSCRGIPEEVEDEPVEYDVVMRELDGDELEAFEEKMVALQENFLYNHCKSGLTAASRTWRPS